MLDNVPELTPAIVAGEVCYALDITDETRKTELIAVIELQVRKGAPLAAIGADMIGAYTEMCEQARQQAYDLMIEHAMEVGANAVVGLHYDASEVVGRESATEVLCYGTAVVIEPLPRS